MYNIENIYNKLVEKTLDDSSQLKNKELKKIENLSEELATDIIRYKVHNVGKPRNSVAAIMRRSVDEISERHQLFLNSMSSKLNITRETCTLTFTKVLDEMFADKQVNWGRIVAVYLFVAQLAKYCNDQSMAYLIPLFPLLVKEYVALHLSKWILQNGGWDAYVQKFSDSRETEKRIFKGLLFTGLGLTVLAGIVAVR